MCGIFGLWSERDELARLGAALAHRGPDGDGRFDSGLIHLGNRRLAILDLSDRGRQPMVSEDGSLALTFNGEIYNHRELRRRLERERLRALLHQRADAVEDGGALAAPHPPAARGELLALHPESGAADRAARDEAHRRVPATSDQPSSRATVAASNHGA